MSTTQVLSKDSQKHEKKLNRTGIPDPIKQGFEAYSGISFNDVKIYYNNELPYTYDAKAIARGNDVFITPGNENLLGHELGHVLQQKRGEVNTFKKVNTEPSLEKKADEYYHRALASQSVYNDHLILKTSFVPVVQMCNTHATLPENANKLSLNALLVYIFKNDVLLFNTLEQYSFSHNLNRVWLLFRINAINLLQSMSIEALCSYNEQNFKYILYYIESVRHGTINGMKTVILSPVNIETYGEKLFRKIQFLLEMNKVANNPFQYLCDPSPVDYLINNSLEIVFLKYVINMKQRKISKKELNLIIKYVKVKKDPPFLPTIRNFHRFSKNEVDKLVNDYKIIKKFSDRKKELLENKEKEIIPLESSIKEGASQEQSKNLDTEPIQINVDLEKDTYKNDVKATNKKCNEDKFLISLILVTEEDEQGAFLEDEIISPVVLDENMLVIVIDSSCFDETKPLLDVCEIENMIISGHGTSTSIQISTRKSILDTNSKLTRDKSNPWRKKLESLPFAENSTIVLNSCLTNSNKVDSLSLEHQLFSQTLSELEELCKKNGLVYPLHTVNNLRRLTHISLANIVMEKANTIASMIWKSMHTDMEKFKVMRKEIIHNLYIQNVNFKSQKPEKYVQEMKTTFEKELEVKSGILYQLHSIITNFGWDSETYDMDIIMTTMKVLLQVDNISSFLKNLFIEKNIRVLAPVGAINSKSLTLSFEEHSHKLLLANKSENINVLANLVSIDQYNFSDMTGSFSMLIKRWVLDGNLNFITTVKDPSFDEIESFNECITRTIFHIIYNNYRSNIRKALRFSDTITTIQKVLSGRSKIITLFKDPLFIEHKTDFLEKLTLAQKNFIKIPAVITIQIFLHEYKDKKNLLSLGVLFNEHFDKQAYKYICSKTIEQTVCLDVFKSWPFLNVVNFCIYCLNMNIVSWKEHCKQYLQSEMKRIQKSTPDLYGMAQKFFEQAPTVRVFNLVYNIHQTADINDKLFAIIEKDNAYHIILIDESGKLFCHCIKKESSSKQGIVSKQETTSQQETVSQQETTSQQETVNKQNIVNNQEYTFNFDSEKRLISVIPVASIALEDSHSSSITINDK